MRDSAGMVSALARASQSFAQLDQLVHSLSQLSATMVDALRALTSAQIMLHAQVRLHSDAHQVSAELTHSSAHPLLSAQLMLQFNAMMVNA